MKNIICFLLIFNFCSPKGKFVEDKEKNHSEGLFIIDKCQNSFIYIAELNKQGKETLTKGGKLDLVKGEYFKIIDILNIKFPEIGIEFLSLKEGILNLKIINTNYFTQQMGDTGALLFKATVVYSLTENNKVKGVNLIFEEGDHGGRSKTYYRKDFKDFNIENCRD